MSQARNTRRPLTSATAQVLRSERSYSARSVIASTLLGVHPPRLPGRALIRAGALFDIAEGTVRVALSRMAATGELVADDGHYELQGPLRDRQQRQELSRSGGVNEWDGRWRIEIIVAGSSRSAADRSDLRAALQAQRLAEWREGVWLRPDNLPARPDNLPAPPDDDPSGRSGRPATSSSQRSSPGSIVRRQCRRLDAEPADDPAKLAAELWNVTGWAERARLLREAISELIGPLEAGDRSVLPNGFVVSAAALRHFQADPLLPTDLLPKDWPGAALRADYERYDAAFKATLRTAFQAEQ